ncbi:MAG: histidinol dehydrogenase, partial [Planctomycetota bacterium]|nr:histidinol dehydrogenase [Planctomycetota bacterium]
AGSNHMLPTGGSARATGGLSVLDFIRVRTRISSATSVGNERIIRETACLARAEGLEAHARAAEIRLPSTVPA